VFTPVRQWTLTLSYMNPVNHVLRPCFFQIQFNAVFPPPPTIYFKRPLPIRLLDMNLLCTSHVSHVRYMQAYLMSSTALVGPGLFSVSDLFTIGRTHRTRDQIVTRPLPKHRTAQTQNKHIYTNQTSMP
jgi:hypothetical protein